MMSKSIATKKQHRNHAVILAMQPPPEDYNQQKSPAKLYVQTKGICMPMTMQHIHHLMVYFLSDGAQQPTADKTTNTTRSLVLFKPPPALVPAGQNLQSPHHQVNQTNKQTEHRHLRSTQKKVTRKQAGTHNINDSRPSCCEHCCVWCNVQCCSWHASHSKSWRRHHGDSSRCPAKLHSLNNTGFTCQHGHPLQRSWGIGGGRSPAGRRALEVNGLLTLQGCLP